MGRIRSHLKEKNNLKGLCAECLLDAQRLCRVPLAVKNKSNSLPKSAFRKKITYILKKKNNINFPSAETFFIKDNVTEISKKSQV
jgi:hypothetical protein